jgi:5-methylcytosine-specific restriction endonuclease McrA
MHVIPNGLLFFNVDKIWRLTMVTSILQLDIAGNPAGWINHRQAILLVASDRVVAGLGDHDFVFQGGVNRITRSRSCVTVSSILLTRERVVGNRWQHNFEAPLTNKGLFARDRYLCLYCGQSHVPSQLTMDHVMPKSRGGADTWVNAATACRKCNHAKGNRTPEEWGHHLLAVPFAPNWAEYLYLKNTRRIIADQMAFLKSRFRKDSPLLA